MNRLTHNAPVYRTADIRAIEAAATAALPQPGLMARAGLAAAEIARSVAASGRVLVVAGPGNNGGDAFVVARHLKTWFYKVDVVFSGTTAKLPADAKAAHEAWLACGGSTLPSIPDNGTWDLVIDGLFGIGLQRDISSDTAKLINTINALGAPVLALDLPSGLDSDGGRMRGPTIRAAHTVTFIALKPGLLTGDGPDCCGQIHVCDLDIDVEAIKAPTGRVTGENILREALPPRRANTHKGSYGSVGIIGGAAGMVGAALLAGRAALHLGAGRVFVGLLDANAPRVDPAQPELMLRADNEIAALDHLSCIAIGPGLGTSDAAREHLRAALKGKLPLVIDADALNLLAGDSALQATLHHRSGDCILTPHPAEGARLLGYSTSAIQSDRIASACEIARRHKSHVVLKGAGSVCATPDGQWFINTSGNPGMASAGMGDVLSGIIAALLAQGASTRNALLAGVYLHGAAADDLVTAGAGPIGLTAGEVALAARQRINR